MMVDCLALNRTSLSPFLPVQLTAGEGEESFLCLHMFASVLVPCFIVNHLRKEGINFGSKLNSTVFHGGEGVVAEA